MLFTYAADSEIGGAIDCVKIAMADNTLTTVGNTAMRDGVMNLICATTQPFVVGSPYAVGSGSAILFLVKRGSFVASALQTAVQAITGLSSATVTITGTLAG